NSQWSIVSSLERGLAPARLDDRADRLPLLSLPGRRRRAALPARYRLLLQSREAASRRPHVLRVDRHLHLGKPRRAVPESRGRHVEWLAAWRRRLWPAHSLGAAGFLSLVARAGRGDRLRRLRLCACPQQGS